MFLYDIPPESDLSEQASEYPRWKMHGLSQPNLGGEMPPLCHMLLVTQNNCGPFWKVTDPTRVYQEAGSMGAIQEASYHSGNLISRIYIPLGQL